MVDADRRTRLALRLALQPSPSISRSLITVTRGRVVLAVGSRQAPSALATAQACSVASDPPAHQTVSEPLPGGLPVLFRTPFRGAVGPHHLCPVASCLVKGDGAGGSAAKTAADPPAPVSFVSSGSGISRTDLVLRSGHASVSEVRRLGWSRGLQILLKVIAAGLMDVPSDRREQGLVDSVTRDVQPTFGRLGSPPQDAGPGLAGRHRERAVRVGGGVW
jgi:hypothetical protein